MTRFQLGAGVSRDVATDWGCDTDRSDGLGFVETWYNDRE